MSRRQKSQGKPNPTARAEREAARGNYQDAFADKERAKGMKKFPWDKADPNNDAKWYYKAKAVLDDVASYSFSTALGRRIHFEKMFPAVPGVTAGPGSGGATIPGVMAIQVLPVPGISVDAQSPINLASQNVYSYIRYKNSGGKNYDAPDLMLYFYAMDNLYAAWNWGKRIYGYTSTYSQTNTYLPEALAVADNVDLSSFRSNLADFRAFMNIAADRISAFCVPATFSIMIRHSWIFTNLFKDSNTRKAQTYMYTPGGFYQYDETSSPQGGRLNLIGLNIKGTESKVTFSSYMQMLNSMINALQYSEDIGVMSGDVLKAYGESNLFTLSLISADYRVEPVYSKEVLTQIENAIFFGYPQFIADNISTFDIYQDPDTNFIKFQPVLDIGATTLAAQFGNFVNFHWDNPTSEDVMVATRINMAYVYDDSNTGHHTLTFTDCGSELAFRCNIIYLAPEATLNTVDSGGPLSPQVLSVHTAAFGNAGYTNAQEVDYAFVVWAVSAFDWAPQVYFRLWTGATPQQSLIMPSFRDWDVFTYCDANDYEAMNLLALLTEFNVPN